MLTSLALALFLGQANMGLTVPTPGVTPGPTYATNISNDLVIIDAHNHTPGNGVLVPTAGLNINANLPFNGFGATGFNSCTGTACGIAVPFLGTFVADAGDVGGLTVRGPDTALAGANVDGGLLVGGAVMGDAGYFETVNPANGVIESLPTTTLALKGNAAANGIGVSLDNVTPLTAGSIVAFNVAGASKATINNAGKFLSNPGIYSTGITNTPGELLGTGTAGNTETILDGTVDVTGTGYITKFNALGTAELAVTGRGHLIPLSTAPSAGVPNAGCYGTISAPSITGGDLSLRYNFTSGTAGSCPAFTALIRFTLNQAYANAAQTNCFASFQGIPTAGMGPLQCNWVSANQIDVYNVAALTTATTTLYSIAVVTVAAGAAN